MIHRTQSPWQLQSVLNWQQQLQRVIEDPQVLLQRLDLDMALLPAAIQAARQFPLRVPESFVERMGKGNINDPLLRQVLPIDKELIVHDGYSQDPLAEQENPGKGIIQKYRGRVLLMVSRHCAVNCRYCFRRHFPYNEHRMSRQQWLILLDQLRRDTSIREVIFSGGDPLAASDRHLRWLSEQLDNIPHIQRLRIHSRLPVVIPARLTEDLMGWLARSRLKPVMVLHINHPNEINDELALSLQKLRSSGVALLNQAVLLRGVNDRTEIQVKLSEKLFDSGILPYYLHLFDRVAGAAHFDLPSERIKALYRSMRKQLPGYLLPRLVREIPGKDSKTQIWF